MNMKYMVVKSEILQKIAASFSTAEEFLQFASTLQSLVKELEFGNQLIERNIEDENIVNVSILKQIFLFGVFCRANMDVVKEIVNVVEFKEISKEESDQMRKDFGGNGLV